MNLTPSGFQNKKFIIVTTINEPTLAVNLFSQINDYKLVIVADRKTPKSWELENTKFLSIVAQKNLDFRISDMLPFDHYSRKNLGYLYAIKCGAEVIVDTDDDNIPKSDWSIPNFQDTYLTSSTNLGFMNVYKTYSNMHIWPRGFPLDLVNSEKSNLKKSELEYKNVNVGVWQGLADEDPDVDAIYRLILNTPCFFEELDPIVLAKGSYCPFNSQNTAFQKNVFPLLYLPSYVSFRYTDILRGLIAQPIMSLMGYHLGFTKATVTQKRNPHDYNKDFELEIPCYLHPYNVIEIVNSSIKSSSSITENLYNAYSALCDKKIVDIQELEILDAWIEDIKK